MEFPLSNQEEITSVQPHEGGEALLGKQMWAEREGKTLLGRDVGREGGETLLGKELWAEREGEYFQTKSRGNQVSKAVSLYTRLKALHPGPPQLPHIPRECNSQLQAHPHQRFESLAGRTIVEICCRQNDRSIVSVTAEPFHSFGHRLIDMSIPRIDKPQLDAFRCNTRATAIRCT